MDRRAWWATVYGVTKNQTRLSNYYFHFQVWHWLWSRWGNQKIPSLHHVTLPSAIHLMPVHMWPNGLTHQHSTKEKIKSDKWSITKSTLWKGKRTTTDSKSPFTGSSLPWPWPGSRWPAREHYTRLLLTSVIFLINTNVALSLLPETVRMCCGTVFWNVMSSKSFIYSPSTIFNKISAAILWYYTVLHNPHLTP